MEADMSDDVTLKLACPHCGKNPMEATFTERPVVDTSIATCRDCGVVFGTYLAARIQIAETGVAETKHKMSQYGRKMRWNI